MIRRFVAAVLAPELTHFRHELRRLWDDFLRHAQDVSATHALWAELDEFRDDAKALSATVEELYRRIVELSKRPAWLDQERYDNQAKLLADARNQLGRMDLELADARARITSNHEQVRGVVRELDTRLGALET